MRRGPSDRRVSGSRPSARGGSLVRGRIHSPAWTTSAGSRACPSSTGRRSGPRREARPDRPRCQPSLQGLPPRSVPEVAPTPLQHHYVLLSVAGPHRRHRSRSRALELGVSPVSPLVKLCVLIGAPLLVLTTADAVVRIWRSAWAWMPVDRGKGLFRLAWVAVSIVGLAALVAAALLILLAW